MEINVIIPSYKRSHNLVGKDYFTMAKYCVPESQAADYVAVVGDDRVIAIPDEHDGNLTKKLNWILDNIPRPLIMIDDDVSELMYIEGGEYFRRYGKARERITYPQERLEDFFINGFNMAHSFGAKMWGLNVNTDGRNYQQYKPFSLSQVVLGPFTAHLDHDLKYDPVVGLKSDYDMSLQQLQKYKKLLRFNLFAYNAEHGDNKGGVVGFRTSELEESYCKAIMLKWGKSIISYRIPPKKKTDLLNAKSVNIPIKGV